MEHTPDSPSNSGELFSKKLKLNTDMFTCQVALTSSRGTLHSSYSKSKKILSQGVLIWAHSRSHIIDNMGGNLTIFNKDHNTAEEGWSRIASSPSEAKFLQPSIRLHYNDYVQLVATKRGQMRVANLKFFNSRLLPPPLFKFGTRIQSPSIATN